VPTLAAAAAAGLPLKLDRRIPATTMAIMRVMKEHLSHLRTVHVAPGGYRQSLPVAFRAVHSVLREASRTWDVNAGSPAGPTPLSPQARGASPELAGIDYCLPIVAGQP
jgi:hypothetical protein